MCAGDDPGDEDSESDASSSPMSEEEREPKKASASKQGSGAAAGTEPKKGQRGRKRRTEPIVVTKEDGTREEVSPQVYRRLRRWGPSSCTLSDPYTQRDAVVRAESCACHPEPSLERD